MDSLYNEKMEALISAALMDGVLTEKEKQVLFKKAQEQGIDLDEFEMVLNARLAELHKKEKAHSSSKSTKLGDVRKCPKCGAEIGSFQMTCPECGYEFNGVGVNQYVENFSRQLQKLPETIDFGKQHRQDILTKIFDTGGASEQMRRELMLQQAEARFVKNYPLPMTIEDCIEMLNFIAPKISESEYSNLAVGAYKQKYNAILSKLEREASNNPQILETIKQYRGKKRTGIFSYVITWYHSLNQRTRTIVGILIFFVVVYGGGNLLFSCLNRHSEKTDAQVATYVNRGEIVKAISLVREGADPSPLYDYYMSKGMWEDAEDYIPHRYSAVSKEEYFNYLKKSVTAMCMEGKSELYIKKFIKRKVAFYEKYNSPESSYYEEWNPTIVEKRLNAILSNY